MKNPILFLIAIFGVISFASEIPGSEIPTSMKPWKSKIDTLTPFEKRVIIDKGTERAYTGEYVYTKEDGIYRCKVCNAPLFKSTDKFASHCGWPSFDEAIPGAVKEVPDKDRYRTEIICANCGAHLGHVFRGEGYTSKNTRHCVNSISIVLDKNATKQHQAKAYFAGGCFWGVEYYMEKIEGVKEVTSGFMGGDLKNPGYYDVVRGNTGHLETVEVLYDPAKVSYETLAKTFFEIHDPTQADGQGPDRGSQYLSAIFVNNDKERKVVNKLIERLKEKGYKVVTKVLDASSFYPAEKYHQDYYERKGSTPYCHRRVKRFD
jgi:peptide methionine sulfoxide reductase msrA/msrB